MCGFAGVMNRERPSPSISESLLYKMTGVIRHRGPDECSVYSESGFGVGHARLSIIDVTSGQQPMKDADSGVVLAYNGEVFNYIELRQSLKSLNHPFRTDSDTEVVLRAYLEYGADFVSHFNGQFAIALWDPREQKLVLARDRVGICPLFYSIDENRVVFGSEVKAMVPALPTALRLDTSVLDEIFTFWAPLGKKSVFENVDTVAPGEIVSITRTTLTKQQYWSWSYSTKASQYAADDRELAEELYDLLFDATRLRLRSDVPVAAYLSGGLDSSSLTALINKVSPDKLSTFSLGFEDRAFDESGFQKSLVDHLNVRHHHLSVSNQDIAEAFVTSVKHTESPILRAAPVPMGLLSKNAHVNGYKVVLTGEGADEVLGGYDLFKEAKIRQFWARYPDSTRRPLLLKKLYPYLNLPADGQADFLKSFFGGMLDQPDHSLFSHMPRWTTTSKSKLFYSDDLQASLKDNALDRAEQKFSELTASMSPFNRSQYIESTLLMPGYLLSSQGDRMLSMNSVEGRFPFLDHRVIEFASRLPEASKMKVLNEKYLLKEAMKSNLPGSIWRRSKQPFRAPDSSLIPNLLQHDLTRSYLTEHALKQSNLFDVAKVNRLVKKASQRGLNVSESQSLIGILSTQIVANEFTNLHV